MFYLMTIQAHENQLIYYKMLNTLIQVLLIDDWHNTSEAIETAKGKYKGAETFTEVKNKIKRKWQQKKKR